MSISAHSYLGEPGSEGYDPYSRRYDEYYADVPDQRDRNETNHAHTALNRFMYDGTQSRGNGDARGAYFANQGAMVIAGLSPDCYEIPTCYYGSVLNKAPRVIIADFARGILGKIRKTLEDEQDFLSGYERIQDLRCVRRDFTKGRSTAFDRYFIGAIEDAKRRDGYEQLRLKIDQFDIQLLASSKDDASLLPPPSAEGRREVPHFSYEHGFVFQHLVEEVGGLRQGILLDILDGMIQPTEIAFRSCARDLRAQDVISHTELKMSYEKWHQIVRDTNNYFASQLLKDAFTAHPEARFFISGAEDVRYSGEDISTNTLQRLDIGKMASMTGFEDQLVTNVVHDWKVSHHGRLAQPNHVHKYGAYEVYLRQ